MTASVAPRRTGSRGAVARGSRALVGLVKQGRRAKLAAQPLYAPVTALGWGVLAGGVLCWLLGWRFGWVELMTIAAAAWLLFALCALLLIGRANLEVSVLVDPLRVTVGETVSGEVLVTNASKRPLLPISLELPVGPSPVRFGLPPLGPGRRHEEYFVVPTSRRSVVDIGPALTVRGDPLGLLRRTVAWTQRVELFVHPRTVALEPLGTGLLRDLEGRTTNDLSMSDLAFHALRDYQPGDDRRYIHWRSSAKVGAGQPGGHFLVRQFLDTRRSHLCVLVDSHLRSFRDDDEYEMAISAAASVAVRSVLDEQEVTVLAGAHASPSAGDRRVLDTFSRAELGEHGLADLAPRAVRMAPDASIALMVTGPLVSFAQMRQACAHFAPEVRLFGLRVDPSSRTGISGARGLTVLSLQSLSELAALLSGGML